jgi:glutathione-regulated potassium-efflux system ancillary protein KefC
VSDLLADVPGDPLWILAALLFGLLAKGLRIPPLVGFLVAGFVLNAVGLEPTAFLEEVSELGVTLLLFTIGLHLSLSVFTRTEVWGVAVAHVVLFGSLLSLVLFVGVLVGFGPLADLSGPATVTMALALSFSSTVFAAKVLEAQGAERSRHGRIAFGVLIIQDIVAVAFLAVIDAEKRPSLWMVALLALPLLRKPLQRIMQACGHGELLVIFGVVVAAAGAGLFELVGLKGDLGALAAGLLLAGSAKADELSRIMDSFKDLFLAGFFVGVGLGAQFDPGGALLGVLLLLALPLKAFGFFALFSAARLRSQTAWKASLELTTYSEFGLIVVATSVKTGLLPDAMLTTVSITVALSLVVASPVVLSGDALYVRWRDRLHKWQRSSRIPGDEDLDLRPVLVMVFGLGRIGKATLTAVEQEFPDKVLGVDFDPELVELRRQQGHYVVVGDAADPEFWSRTAGELNELDWVLLTVSSHEANLAAVELLRTGGYTGRIIATSRYADDAAELRLVGADAVFDIFTEAGAGFASDLDRRFHGHETGIIDLDHLFRPEDGQLPGQ